MKDFLSPRLKTIASKVKIGERIVDIGTDHAYVPIYLLENNLASSVIATDIKKMPLKTAAKNISLYGLEGKIKTVLTNGVNDIGEDEYDAVVVAGMGGVLITEIIASVPDSKRLILQPMTAVPELRAFLYDNKYEILDEELVAEEDKIYVVIVAQKGAGLQYDLLDIYVGRKILEKKDPLMDTYITKLKNKTNTIVSGMKAAKNPDTSVLCKYENLLAILNELPEI
jgi:tRNA (adenine22-N1)-methyltransferase